MADFPLDFEKVVRLWERVFNENIADKLAEMAVRKTGLEIPIMPEKIYVGDRDADYFLKESDRFVMVLFWNDMTEFEEMDQGGSLDDWVMGVTIALRQKARKSTNAWRQLMSITIGVREIIRANITLESVADPKDYDHLKSVKMLTGSESEHLQIGTALFKTATLFVRHRIMTP